MLTCYAKRGNLRDTIQIEQLESMLILLNLQSSLCEVSKKETHCWCSKARAIDRKQLVLVFVKTKIQ